jgi:hypothetical protein
MPSQTPKVEEVASDPSVIFLLVLLLLRRLLLLCRLLILLLLLLLLLLILIHHDVIFLYPLVWWPSVHSAHHKTVPLEFLHTFKEHITVLAAPSKVQVNLRHMGFRLIFVEELCWVHCWRDHFVPKQIFLFVASLTLKGNKRRGNKMYFPIFLCMNIYSAIEFFLFFSFLLLLLLPRLPILLRHGTECNKLLCLIFCLLGGGESAFRDDTSLDQKLYQ